MVTMTEASARLGVVRRRLLDLLLPPRCLGCGAIVGDAAALCAGCWSRLAFIEAPLCVCCGRPFEFALGEAALCGTCSKARPLYERARAALRYDDASRDLVLAFKHGDRTDCAPALGAWLARAGAELVADCDLVVPVPLHWWRLFRRRYNQSALLAHALGRQTGKPVAPDLLRRTRATASQGHLGRAQRRRNVARAFRVDPGRRGALDGKRILLVDDVLTTGATAESATEALLEAGARAVDLLTIARVVRPEYD